MNIERNQFKDLALAFGADLYKFARGILDFKEMDDPLHKGWAEILERVPRRLLFLAPRKHFKSSLFTISYVIWRLVRNRNLRILIVSEEGGLARSFLKAIRRHFEGNTKLMAVFNEGRPFTDDSDEWRADSVTLKRTIISKDPSVKAVGIGGNIVGYAPDLVILDDTVNRKDLESPAAREGKIAWFKALQSVVDPIQGQIVVVGCRWHFADLYGFILGEREHEGDRCSDEYETHILSAIDRNWTTPLFPQRFTVDTLKKIRDSGIGKTFFDAHYLNDPSGFVGNIWLGEKFLHGSAPDDLRDVTISVDPAVKKSEESDYWGFVVGGLSGLPGVEQAYVQLGLQEHVTFSGALSTIDRLIRVYGATQLAIETVGAQDWLAQVLEELVFDEVIPQVKIIRVTRPTGKEIRAHYLTRHVEAGRVVFCKGTDALRSELVSFPKGLHDDLHDAFCGLLECLLGIARKVKTPMKSRGYGPSFGSNAIANKYSRMMQVGDF